MMMWIFHLLMIGVVSFVAYGICIALNNNQMSKTIIVVAILLMVTATVKDLLPVMRGIGEKVTSIQETGDKLANFGKDDWVMPMKGTVTQEFKGTDHHGLDIGAVLGTPVEATRKGQVESVSWSDIYGNVVVVDHGDGIESLYAHLQRINVKKGYPVIAGTKIGSCGETGNARGVHLHFEIRKNGIAENPRNYL